MQKKTKTKEVMSLEEIRLSPDRMEPLKDGWFRDKYLTVYYGRNFDWSPVPLEKHIFWKEGEKHAQKFGLQPSRFEVESILDLSKHNPALVPGAVVLGLKIDDYYWTREEYAGSSDGAWCVGLRYGSVDYCYKGNYYYVRPVRSSQRLKDKHLLVWKYLSVLS
jgi:hypothetical protein